MIPDPELVVGTYLRTELAGLTRVVGRTPRDTGRPWVRLTLLDAPSTDQREHHIAAYVQLDCYAGTQDESGQEEASLIARRVRAALADLEGVRSGVVVTGCRIDGHARIPDTDFEPARERITLTATAWMHG